MSTIFDSEVYAMRKGAPCAYVSAPLVMASILDLDCECKEITLSVCYRHDVASRRWWTLSYTYRGQSHSVSAQEPQLCLWRAVQMLKNHQRTEDLEWKTPVSRGVGFFAEQIFGWQHGDGI
jgi:hypothetical protein